MESYNGWFLLERGNVKNTREAGTTRGENTAQNRRAEMAAQPQGRESAQNPEPPLKGFSKGTLEADKTHSQTIGTGGPVLVQDTVLHETLEDFAFSTALPRVVHTKGYGAFGSFKTTNSMREYTKAGFLQSTGAQVPAAVRFSLAASNYGTPDTLRNIRGFTTRLYADEGNFDLVCNHLPVFFVRDAMRVPDVISRLAPSPINNMADPDSFWSVFTKYPEASNILIWLFSDLGTVKSFRHIRGYSVSTYVWRNSRDERRYVKYHWLPAAGEEAISREEAQRLACESPDFSGQDLYNSIAAGASAEFELRVQLMEIEEAKTLEFDPLDDTKVWDEARFPLLPVGRLVLNRNPENYREQVEKLAFSPSNLVPGIELSDDKMLQGRSFIYSDAQRHRLGPDFRNIPVNKQQGWTPESMVSSGEGRHVAGEIMRAEILKPDNFSQATEKYNSFTAEERDSLAGNIAAQLSPASAETKRAVMARLGQISTELADKVKNMLSS